MIALTRFPFDDVRDGDVFRDDCGEFFLGPHAETGLQLGLLTPEREQSKLAVRREQIGRLLERRLRRAQ